MLRYRSFGPGHCLKHIAAMCREGDNWECVWANGEVGYCGPHYDTRKWRIYATDRQFHANNYYWLFEGYL